MTNSKPKHTPGPWTTGFSIKTVNMDKAMKNKQYNQVHAGSECICDVHSCLGAGPDNAHLISAAPEMLECLQSIVQQINNVPVERYEDWLELANALRSNALKAIAKARGES